MVVPTILQEAINSELQLLHANRNYELTPQKRSAIYSKFDLQNSPMGKKALGWLAVQSAKLVLPIFEETFPEEYFSELTEEERVELVELAPANLIGIAEKVLQGVVDIELAKELATGAYDIQWCYAKPNVPNGADLAANAALRALNESCGHIPFHYLEHYKKIVLNNLDWTEHSKRVSEATNLQEMVIGLQESFQNKSVTVNNIGGSDWTDKDLAMSAGDTASAAVMAYSCGLDFSNPFNPNCDPIKVREFWEWWLTEAMQEAWGLAES